MVLEESNTDDANTMTVDDIRFIISDNLEEFVEVLNIDYINKWYRKGFLITYNGKTASTCG